MTTYAKFKTLDTEDQLDVIKSETLSTRFINSIIKDYPNFCEELVFCQNLNYKQFSEIFSKNINHKSFNKYLFFKYADNKDIIKILAKERLEYFSYTNEIGSEFKQYLIFFNRDDEILEYLIGCNILVADMIDNPSDKLKIEIEKIKKLNSL